jgi:hypothetical protein
VLRRHATHHLTKVTNNRSLSDHPASTVEPHGQSHAAHAQHAARSHPSPSTPAPHPLKHPAASQWPYLHCPLAQASILPPQVTHPAATQSCRMRCAPPSQPSWNGIVASHVLAAPGLKCGRDFDSLLTTIAAGRDLVAPALYSDKQGHGQPWDGSYSHRRYAV